MKTESKIFDKSNLKGISEELKNEILQRFNDYDTMKRVIITIANNLRSMIDNSPNMDYRDKSDIRTFSNLLKSATNTQWLKENNLYF